MSGDKMDVEVAEERMKALDHSEQHYFKRLGSPFFLRRVTPGLFPTGSMLTPWATAMITTV